LNTYCLITSDGKKLERIAAGLVLHLHSHVDTLGRTMRHVSIGCSVAVLLWAASFAGAQEKSTPSQGPQPFLKPCTAKNPQPCADKPPRLSYGPNPECSKEARKARIHGTVVLTVVVATDGLAHDISVVRSVGYGLDEEAINAVKKWRFKPGQGSGKPAPIQMTVESAFHCPE
jgi:TonB family protein